MLRSFLRNRAGNFGMLAAVAAMPLLLSVAFATDYAAVLRARTHLQLAADAASLGLASSRVTDKQALEKMADNFIKANTIPKEFTSVKLASLASSNDQVNLTVSGSIQPNFTGLLNIKTVDINVKSVASRSMVGSVEVALVLDNTWSMSQADAKGIKKIDALKSAGKTLVAQLFSNTGADVRVAVVPYADYVNVGTSNRSATWLSVPADYSQTTPGSCPKPVTQEKTCKTYEKKTCYSTTDGVTTSYSCNGSCLEYNPTVYYDPPKQGACTIDKTTTYTWYGCVGSRLIGSLQSGDSSPNVPYPGLVQSSQQCPSQILTLNSNATTVQDKVKAMAPKSGSLTYTPSGLTWGLNVLSPPEPLTEGKAYDTANRKPRKVLVLMTDGENTMRYNNNAKNGVDSTDGTHKAITFNGDGSVPAASAAQIATANSDTIALCDTIKSADRGIEIFTVALMVDDDAAKTMLQSCASNSKGTLDHYYPADDAAALAAAFNNIGQKLSVVRLVE